MHPIILNMKKILNSKWMSVENLTFIGAALGVIVGLTRPDFTQSISVLGDIFIILLKGIILPLILSSVFISISQASGHLKELGGKTFVYFLMTSALACLTGLIVANIVLIKPETALNFKNFDAAHVKEIAGRDVILSFFSGNLFKSLSEGQILPLVLFAIVAGIASTKLQPPENLSLSHLARAVHDLMMIIMRWILWIAPIGVFALVSTVIASVQDIQFSQLANFFLAVAIAALTHSLITLPTLGALLGRFHPYKFILQIREAMVVALATASSSATLPVSIKTIESQGVSQKVSGFVLPLGASLNMNGSALYQALVILFLGKMVGMDFPVSQQLVIFILVMLSAAGTAGIPGGGLMMMTATLHTVGLPVELIGFYLLVDRFWDAPITMINVMDDLFAAKTIDRWISKE